MFPTTGSTITAAIPPGLSATREFTEARSLNVALSVPEATPAGTPGLSGTLSVIAPDPALIRNASPCP